MRPRSCALLALALALGSACGGPTDPQALTDEGYAQLGRSDWSAAGETFEKAVRALKPGDPQYVRARMGLIESLIHVVPERAKTEFLDLAAKNPDAIDAGEFAKVAEKMVQAKRYVQAVDVLDVGVRRFSEDVRLKEKIDRVKAEAEKAGDPAAMAKLKSLGYL